MELPASLIPLPRGLAGVSRHDLELHVAFWRRASLSGSTLDVTPVDAPGPLILRREGRVRSPGYIALRASSGHLGRDAVIAIREKLDSQSKSYRTSVTRHRGLLRDVQLRFSLADPFLVPQITHTLLDLSDYFMGHRVESFGLLYAPPFSPEYSVKQDDPLQPSRSAEIGARLGRLVGSFLRPFGRG
jgi:hypothetical protein